MRTFGLLALVLAVGCGGQLGDGLSIEEQCALNQPPRAPLIATPFAGSEHLLADEIAISATPYEDVDGDPVGGAEVEVWTVSPSGVMVARVWSATFPSGMPPLVKLEDGQYDLGLFSLQEDTRYAAQVRYRDARPPVSGVDCSSWGPWSEPRHFATDNGSRVFFDQARIQDIMIEIPPASWTVIAAQARPPGCVPYERDYQVGNVVVGGQRFDGVGLKAKGGCGSARNINQKMSFKINLSWDDPAVAGCPDKRRYAGQRSLTLNNSVQDRTGSHERLAYEIYHAMGVGSSRMAHVRVHVNGTFWGLYNMLETVERPMLARWYKSNGGMLYEGTYWCDIITANLPVGDADNKCLTREFHPDVCDSAPDPGDDPQTYGPLRDLVAKLDALPAGTFLPEARAFLDVDEFLSLWAVDSLLDNWDSYTLNIVNNYRIYHDPATDLWHIIPSGLDQTMVGDGVNPFGPNARIARQCLADPDCKDAFAARLREAAAVFESMDLVDRARAIHDQIRSDVMADPRKEYDMGTWENLHTNWRNWIRVRPSQICQRLANAGFPNPGGPCPPAPPATP